MTITRYQNVSRAQIIKAGFEDVDARIVEILKRFFSETWREGHGYVVYVSYEWYSVTGIRANMTLFQPGLQDKHRLDIFGPGIVRGARAIDLSLAEKIELLLHVPERMSPEPTRPARRLYRSRWPNPWEPT